MMHLGNGDMENWTMWT